MTENQFALIYIFSTLVMLVVLLALVLTNRRQMAELTAALERVNNDRRITDTVEKAYLNSTEQVKLVVQFVGGVVDTLAKLNLPVVDPIADQVDRFLETVTDGEPNPGAPATADPDAQG